MKLKVKKSQEIWRSDDDRIAIYQVMAEEGDVYKTRSKAIGMASPGTEFEVQVNPEVNRFGQEEKWVKQEPKLPPNKLAIMRDTASIERQVALKAAVDFASSRDQMKASDVVKLAGEFDKFLKEGRAKDEATPTR